MRRVGDWHSESHGQEERRALTRDTVVAVVVDAGSKPKGNAGKKAGGSKPKKAGMFKALKKQEKRAGVVGADKNDPHSSKRKAKVAKRPAPVSDEFRNFDERMAAKSARRPGVVPKAAAVAPPTFVMAAPTFQFNSNPVQPTPVPREVEGFHGFMSALEAPRDAPAVNPNNAARQPKPVQPEYRGSNVFAVLDDARAAGWVAKPPPSPRTITEIYGFYDFSKINFSHLTDQIPTWIAMYFVVAFSSSLDVAAVETALGKPLDHNHELQTVGISNLLSGLGGGFTGSYLFSQTIFTLRGKLDTRYVGLIVFALEIAIVLSPFSIIAYVPKVFFGALQMLVCLDLMLEWLYHARNKLLPREYGIVWFTFLSMVFVNLEGGILIGIVVAGFNFIYSYVATSNIHRVMKRSRVERDLRERVLLQNMRMSIVTLELEGYIFFGSSVKVMDEVRRHVLVTTTEKQEAQTSTLSGASPLLSRRHAPSPYVARSLEDTFNDDLATLDSVFDDQEIHGYSSTPKAGKSGQAALHAARTRYFILDFEKVSGVDATAVRSCFNATKELLAQHGIALIFASVPTDAERLLRVHDVIEKEDGSGTGSLVFDTLDKALEWCEDELLVSEGVLPLSESTPALAVNGGNEGQHWQLLDELLPRPDGSHRKDDKSALTNSDGTQLPACNEAGAVLTRELGEMYVTHSLKQEGETLYRAGGLVNGVYFIGYGKVDVFMPSKIHEGLGPGFRGRKRITRVCQGGLVGASEMILHKRHQFTAPGSGTQLHLLPKQVSLRADAEGAPYLGCALPAGNVAVHGHCVNTTTKQQGVVNHPTALSPGSADGGGGGKSHATESGPGQRARTLRDVTDLSSASASASSGVRAAAAAAVAATSVPAAAPRSIGFYCYEGWTCSTARRRPARRCPPARERAVDVPQRAVGAAGVLEEELSLRVVDLGVDGGHCAVLEHQVALRRAAHHEGAVDVVVHEHLVAELVARGQVERGRRVLGDDLEHDAGRVEAVGQQRQHLAVGQARLARVRGLADGAGARVALVQHGADLVLLAHLQGAMSGLSSSVSS
ncbi:hypothetical protein ON010_g13886 [Phytophthora cinnamomi]|nr:hypothetical protein ON010_g13886 [Phytophthora cinnamomi]